jgi:glycosyltransferase involved in cell wall biosynthesis/SAM-dependent methyltransferase
VSEPLRILTISNWYPPHHYGGYELSCADVNRRLVARGHHVEVLCSDHLSGGAVAAGEADGAVVRRELRLYWRDERPWAPSITERLAIERHNQACLRRALDEVQPDVVALWQIAVLSVGLVSTLAQRGIPMVFAVCDDWLTYAVGQDGWARMFSGSAPRRALGRVAARVLDLPTTAPDIGAHGTFLFVSDATKRIAETHSHRSFERAAVVYSGIEGSVFAPTPDRLADRPWRWRLLWVGRFDPRKGAATAISALEHLPDDATLVLCGRGDPAEAARLSALSTELGVRDRVTITTAAREALPDVYGSADAFLFTSEWTEPFGLTPIEAMACGTPVVGTNLGGSAEFLVHGANALVVPPHDPVTLARAVTLLADEPALRRQLIEGGARTAEALTTDHLADTFEAWYSAAAVRFRDGAPPERELPALTRGVDLTYPVPPMDDHPLARHQGSAPQVLASGTADEIKRLYVDLGDDWWSAYGSDVESIPVLSAPETAPAVLARMRPVRGLVLDAGCGPNPAVSLGMAAEGAKTVVSLDIGWGTVRVALTAARRAGSRLLGVVGDVERLPFRAGAFDGVVCDDTIEHLPDDATGVAELARVAKAAATVVLATPNRHNLDIVRAKMRDRARQVRKPPSDYFVSNSHIREYTWGEFEALVRPSLSIVDRQPVGWDRSPKARRASSLLALPLMRHLSQMIVLEARPR